MGTRRLQVTIEFDFTTGDVDGFSEYDKKQIIQDVKCALQIHTNRAIEPQEIQCLVIDGGPTVGYDFKSYEGKIYHCESYDASIGFWMVNKEDPSDRRNVSERAIGSTFHLTRTYRIEIKDMFDGSFEQFEDCFFSFPSGSDNQSKIDAIKLFCKQNNYEVTFKKE